MTIIDQAVQRHAKIQSMRDMIDFLEANPIVPLPFFSRVNAWALADSIADIARAMKPCEKSVLGSLYVLRHDFGNDVGLEVNFSRSGVCERVVVGTEDIPERVVPATTRDIVEWVCPDSILNG